MLTAKIDHNNGTHTTKEFATVKEMIEWAIGFSNPFLFRLTVSTNGTPFYMIFKNAERGVPGWQITEEDDNKSKTNNVEGMKSYTEWKRTTKMDTCWHHVDHELV